MEYRFVKIEKDGVFTSVVLNRPEKRNAIHVEMLDEIRAAFEEIDGDAQCRAIFLKGAGKMFSSGIDLNVLMKLTGEIAEGGTRRFRSILLKIQDALNAIEANERPVIAVMHNRVVGLGLELALACDFRILADDAKIGMPETRLGLISDVGGTTRAVRTVGLPRAKELAMTGRFLEPREALAWGLVCRVVPEASLEAEARAFAEQFLPASPVAVGLTKKILDRGMHLDKLTLMQLEGLAQSIVLKSEDLMEAFTAYTQKREPKFKGR